MDEQINLQELENFIEMLDKKNKRDAEKREPLYALADMLAAKNITTLRKMGHFHSIKNSSRMDKPTIIPLLLDKLQDKHIIRLIMLSLDKTSLYLYYDLYRNEPFEDNVLVFSVLYVLKAAGLLSIYFYENRNHYIIPNEIREILSELVADGIINEWEHNELLHVYAKAATNLYGFITMEDFVKIFNRQNKDKTDVQDSFYSLVPHSIEGTDYYFCEDYIVNSDFEDDDGDELIDIIEEAAMKPRYIPKKKEFLKYADPNYVEETPQLDNFRSYLIDELFAEPDTADEIVREMFFMSCRGEDIQAYLDCLSDNEITIEISHAQDILNLIVDLKNNTRLWTNNGHTPNELYTNPRKSFQSQLKPIVKTTTINFNKVFRKRAGNEPEDAAGNESEDEAGNEPKDAAGNEPKGAAGNTAPRTPLRVIKAGRNDPCPCGSGKKYKNCCGRDL